MCGRSWTPVGSERAALFGVSEGGPMCALFAATYPERTRALVLYGTYARLTRAPDYPQGIPDGAVDGWAETIRREWGGPVGIDLWAPSAAHEAAFREWWARLLRLSHPRELMSYLGLTPSEYSSGDQHAHPTAKPARLMDASNRARSPLEGSRRRLNGGAGTARPLRRCGLRSSRLRRPRGPAEHRSVGPWRAARTTPRRAAAAKEPVHNLSKHA